MVKSQRQNVIYNNIWTQASYEKLPTFENTCMHQTAKSKKITKTKAIKSCPVPTLEKATLRRSRSRPSTGETFASDGDPIKTCGQPT